MSLSTSSRRATKRIVSPPAAWKKVKVARAAVPGGVRATSHGMKTSLLSDLTNRLTPLSDTPGLDASVLLAHILDKPRSWVMAHPELTLMPQQQNRLDDSLKRLEGGESFPYVLGHWEFFGLEFEVTPDVLIPRPETELLVERAIAWLQESSTRRRVADVGTGSGAIAISIARNVPDVRVLATDISLKALEVARRNARSFDLLDRIDFVQCDLFPHPHPLLTEGFALSLWERGEGVRVFDLICANLPYIPTDTLRGLPIYGREPTLALDGGGDGLEVVHRLLHVAPAWLALQGKMLLEIESTHGTRALDIAREVFPSASFHLHPDLAGKDRLLEITL